MRRLRPRDYPDPRARYEALVTCGWVSGSLLAIGRRDLEALGGWDDDFWMYSEDVDLCLRAARAGMRSAYTPRAVFSHAHGGASRRDATSRALTRCEAMISKHLYISKHFRGARAAAFHLAHLLQKLPLVTKAMAAAAAPASLFPGVAAQRKMLVDLAAYYRGVLRGDGWLSPRSVRYRP
jgi:hypothetical protein